jgi:hypothetical protein
MLSKVQWAILDALADDTEPVEEIAKDLNLQGYALSADEFLRQILLLSRRSFVSIKQEPIPAFGQNFPTSSVLPESPRDVVGDLWQEFEQSYALGDYLQKESVPAGTTPAGVPLGIYLTMTEAGRREWDSSQYRCYYDAISKNGPNQAL